MFMIRKRKQTSISSAKNYLQNLIGMRSRYHRSPQHSIVKNKMDLKKLLREVLGTSYRNISDK